MKYSDTSKIVTLYTREFGLQKVIAKGARSLNNKFGAALEPATFVSSVFYKKESRDLHLISSADILNAYPLLHSDVYRLSAAFACFELFLQIVRGEEKHDELFTLLSATLQCLDRQECQPLSIFRAFQAKMAMVFGYAPTFSKCPLCGSERFPLNVAHFHILRGGYLCEECADKFNAIRWHEIHETMWSEGNRPAVLEMSATGGAALRAVFEDDLDHVALKSVDDPVAAETDAALRLYLDGHFGLLKPLRSLEVFHQKKRTGMRPEGE